MTSQTAQHVIQARHPAPGRLFPFQDAAVRSRDRLIVVSGGPGTGKTETLTSRVVWLTCELNESPSVLLLATATEDDAADLRRRLGGAMRTAGASERLVRCVLATVAPVATVAERLVGVSSRDGDEEPDPLTSSIPDAAADEVSAALGAECDRATARSLLAAAVLRLGRGYGKIEAGPVTELYGAAAMMRLGVAAVEEVQRDAEGQIYRRLRGRRSEDDPIGNLGMWLRRPADVRAVLPKLRGAINAATHARTDDASELDRLRGLAQVLGLDMLDVARREGAAAPARALVYRVAARLAASGALARGRGGSPASRAARLLTDPAIRAAVCGGVRHVLVDDAHALAPEHLAMLRALSCNGTLFVSGDPGVAGCDRLRRNAFEELQRSVQRGVLLLAAPRFAPACGRIVNRVGERLWPAGCGAGFAPAALSSAQGAPGPALELAVVWRRVATDANGDQHPEPIAQARAREAEMVIERACADRRGGAAACAVLALTEDGVQVLRDALHRRGAEAEGIEVLTIAQARGREWDAVLVAQLDDHYGREFVAPLLDAGSGLPLVAAVGPDGQPVMPLSTVLLLERAAGERQQAGRRRFFGALTRARERLYLSGVTRDKVAGGSSFTAPMEWLRRVLGVERLHRAPSTVRLGDSEVRVTIVT